MKYDLILFEHLHSAYNHRKDVLIIAKLLKKAGWKVAILDIYNDLGNISIDGVSVLSLNFKGKVPDDKFIFKRQSKISRIFSTLKYLYQQYIYMKNVSMEIKDKADSFYVGSYLFFPTTSFLKMNKPCFYWGLRSDRMHSFWKQIHSELLFQAPYLAFFKRSFLKNDKQMLFVSNPIIMKEFISLGVPENRIIIREERPYTYPLVKVEKKSKGVKVFLVIGSLRIEKNVLLTIEAFKRANLSNAVLKIIGFCKNEDYEQQIESAIKGVKNIIRKNCYINDKDFEKYFSEADYVVFADEKSSCCITNGTLEEALSHMTPIIAPNYDPYSYYMKENQIGFLYEPHNLSSYSMVLNEAYRTPISVFQTSIEEHLKSIEFGNVAFKLDNQLRKVFNKDIK